MLEFVLFFKNNEILATLSSIFATDLFYIIGGFLILWLVITFGFKKGGILGTVSLISGAISWSAAILIKNIVSTKRPFQEIGFSPLISDGLSQSAFPSGHTAFIWGTLLFSVLAIYKIDKNKLEIPLILLFLGLIASFSRVAVGVHWPVDIIGGIAFSSIIVLFLLNSMPWRKLKPGTS